MKEADKLDPIAKSCVVALDYSERVNFAFQQNSIPVLRRLEIQNETENDWYQVSCRIKPKPLEDSPGHSPVKLETCPRLLKRV